MSLCVYPHNEDDGLYKNEHDIYPYDDEEVVEHEHKYDVYLSNEDVGEHEDQPWPDTKNG